MQKSTAALASVVLDGVQRKRLFRGRSCEPANWPASYYSLSLSLSLSLRRRYERGVSYRIYVLPPSSAADGISTPLHLFDYGGAHA